MKIKDLVKVFRGSSPRPIIDYLTNSGYRRLKISDFSIGDKFVYNTKEFIKAEGLKNTRYVKKGTLILTNSATPGVPVFLGEDMCLHDGFLYFENLDDSVLDIEYLYCWFLINRLNIINLANGSVFKNLKKEIIENLEIDLPSLNIQQKIVGVFNKINNKIILNNQINHNLYDIGDNLYNEYYKDLKPGYKIVSLKEVSNNFDSKRKPMSSREREKHKGIYPYYGATSIIDYVDDYIFDGTYLLIGEDGTVMTDEGTPVLQYIWGKNRINNHAHVLQGSNISTEHLFFALRTINIKSLITGAVQLKLNQENMNKISFILGTDEINAKFEEKISVIMKKIKNNLVENEKLVNIRDTLLPKLMNGEINLDNVTI